MPTPFTHLEIAQRLLQDERIPMDIRGILTQEKPAFLLGSVAADGRVDLGSARQDTHFYRYDQPQTERGVAYDDASTSYIMVDAADLTSGFPSGICGASGGR